MHLFQQPLEVQRLPSLPAQFREPLLFAQEPVSLRRTNMRVQFLLRRLELPELPGLEAFEWQRLQCSW